MVVFQYHPEILIHYPHLVGGVIFAQQIRNGPTPQSLQSAYRAEQKATLERIGETPFGEIASIAAWRKAFRSFGVKPTQYRSAAEALLRRLTKHGDIPSINTLVDLANMVSIRYAMPVAAFDTRRLTLPITVGFAEGSEPYTPLGQTEIVHPDPGEVVFTDKTGLVIARRWCWRQSDESAAQPDTTQALITVEAHHGNALVDVEAALNDLLALLGEHAGGEYIYGLLDPRQPSIGG
jgi:DNA/RNA-binding domain of Phe-tRNA-synthetase-like protein